MEKESLYIFKLDAQGSKIKFPNADTPAKLGEYTYSAQRMAGTPTLTATLNYPSCLDDFWSGEEFVEFRGEKYYVDQIPTSSKDNKSVMYKHELQFVSERIVLENVYFMDVVTAGADTYHSNSTSVKFMGDINEFVGRLNASMTKSGIGYSVVIDDDITSDSKLVSLENVYLADALQSIYTIYELPYYFVGKVCHIGYTENVISTPFEYRKGLVSIKKTNANYKIVNRVTGVGSSDNIPFYYPNDDETGTIERSQNLMPSIYRQTSGAERFYNALNNTYKIPGTNDYYSFKNTYSAKKVKEIKVDFSDIKPTIEGVTNASGQLFGEIADIAFDANDSDELGTGTGNNVFNGTDEYVHSYFYIKLHIYNGDYGFNLFEQGLEGGTAVINMTTGNCAACEFEIGVTYKDNEPGRAFNPVLVDSAGNLPAGDFEQKVTSQTSQYVESQQNTSTNEVWIAVKKDNTSFGVVMPNATNNYKPSIGDKFVITGIKMPKSLVLAAEKRLDEALIKYMSENNDEKFTFSVNFSRVFLADNIYLWDMLNENARIYIKYNNREYLMYVNSFTCKADKNCLYDISVELTDKLSANVSALRSTITEIAGDIIGNIQGGGYGGDILAKTSKHYIRKDQPDSAKYLVKFLKGIHTGLYTPEESGGMIDEEGNAELKKMSLRSGLDSNGPVTTDEVVSKNFTSGLLGVGHRLWNGVLEVSELIVRKTMHVFEIIVQKVSSVNGSMLTTPGGGVRISEVEELEDGYKCLFNNDDGTIPNPFVVGDQALHQVFTGKNIGRYWRLVTEVGDNYFVLSKTDCEAGSGIPRVEDEIIQFGNRTDKNRQNAVLTTSYGSDAPYTAYYSNVNSYSLEGKEDVREGNLRGINDPDFGQLQGSGFYGKNVYLKGIFRLLSGKTVEESIGDVQSNLDNLQVGETNLLDNSNKGWKNTGYPIATIYLGDYKPKQGEECTIVIKGKLGANKTSWGVYNSGGNVVLASFYPGGPDTDYIALKTFKWTLGTPAVDNTFIRIYPMPNSVSVESEIEWVKLVLGNKTSLLWTPSINDQRQIAIDEAGKVVDGIQIGSQNLISKKMMLKWNEKNKDIAVWGQDEDGVYLNVNHKLLTDYVSGGLDLKDVFGGAIKFKTNTQYVFSVEWKVSANGENDGIRFIFLYTDGSIQYVSLKGNQTTKARINYVTDPGKTISKISSSHGFYAIQSLIYNISLIEGNKPLQGFPVAEEDQVGANNVNLADGTKEFTIGVGSTNYTYKGLYVSKIKPNTVYYVNAGNIQNLVGNPDRYSFVLYNKDISTVLCPTLNADKNGGFLITYNNFTEQEGRLLCYAGIAGSTLGNSVKFTEVMLVEGFLPAPVWAPSFSEQQAEIKTITKTLTEIKAENGEISLRVNEVSERVEEAKQEAIDEAKEYTTIQTYRETDIDLRAEKWDQDTYYPVTIQLSNPETRIEVITRLGDAKPKWSTHEYGFSMNCVWRSNASGWGANVINRIIEVFEYRFTKEIPDTTPVQYILPAGSIGQLASSSEELIYLRGGGRYLFKIGNNCVAVVHDSRYTALDGSSVAPAASVISPVLTNATKEELNAEINITKGLIENKVSLDVYNENDQLIKSDISNLQVSYNQISSTVSKIINGTQEISGVVTQSNFVTIFSSNKNALGQEVIESINVGGGGVTIDASRINLNGAISANGNVQITTDGKLIAVNGEFTGKITATEGEIAGLKLSNNGLRSSDFNASSKIGSCYAKNGFSVYASGSGVLAPSTGMLQAGIITATGTQASITGLEIIAKNTSGNATLSEITALKLRAIDYVDDSIKMAPTAALIVEEGVSIFNGDVEVNGKSTFNGAVYFKNLTEAPSSNYYLCIDRKTKQLYYR
nr:MAG TPA: tail protein [Caudoviricetes sp.]